jgi:hypothetical protein
MHFWNSNVEILRARCVGCLVAAGLSWSAAAAEMRVYRGCCDASGAAALNDEVMAVASDEENVIRLYRRDAGGSPLSMMPTPGVPGLNPGRNELDLEGAAVLEDLVFWIGSHSRNSDAKPRWARHTLFAMRIVGTGMTVRLEAFGRPYHGLVGAMASAPELSRFHLAQAAERAGESAGGLNIEALAAGSGGKLWIGFRNPVPEKKALMIPLVNPTEVIAGRAARFGAPVQLPLGGLGLRDAVKAGDRWLLLAGPAEGGGKHRLFIWTEGAATVAEVAGAIPKGFQAESVLGVGGPELRRADLLSDDGGEKVGGTRCSEVTDVTRRAFRAWRVAY